MEISIGEESISTLSAHSDVSIAFDYDNILELSSPQQGLGGFALTERKLEASRTKDYDIDGERSSSWEKRFDVSRWGLIVARDGDKRIGGAVIAFGDGSVAMLDERRDLAVLWDIRIAHAYRGNGIGVKLFRASEEWARERGCTQLKIETQNINVAACKFYARQGCSLSCINRYAYPSLPNEVQMIWYKDLI